MVLLRTCIPFNRIRLVLLAVVAAAFVLAYLLLGHIFFLTALTSSALMLYGGLILLGAAVIWTAFALFRRKGEL